MLIFCQSFLVTCTVSCFARGKESSRIKRLVPKACHGPCPFYRFFAIAIVHVKRVRAVHSTRPFPGRRWISISIHWHRQSEMEVHQHSTRHRGSYPVCLNTNGPSQFQMSRFESSQKGRFAHQPRGDADSSNKNKLCIFVKIEGTVLVGES